MASRTESFRADDETHRTLNDLGYSEEEIGATAGQLPSEMETEEKLRLSLRALSAQRSEDISQKAKATSPPPNPKVFNKADVPISELSPREAHRRGRQDKQVEEDYETSGMSTEEAYERGRQGKPLREKPAKQPAPRAVRARAPRVVNQAAQARRTYRQASGLYRKLGGKWR